MDKDKENEIRKNEIEKNEIEKKDIQNDVSKDENKKENILLQSDDNKNDVKLKDEKNKIDDSKNKKEKIKNKSAFVPSYKKDKKESSTPKRKINKKRLAISICIFVIAISIIVTIIMLVTKAKYKYGQYDTLMENLLYTNLYNNQKANPSEGVTKSEAIKIILGTSLDTLDIKNKLKGDDLYTYDKSKIGEYSDYVKGKDDSIVIDKIIEYTQKNEETKQERPEEYKNELWIRYANAINMFGGAEEISKNNANDKIKLVDVIRYMGYAKTKILGKTLDTSFTPSFSDYEKYSNEEKSAIADMVFNKIIDDSKGKLNGNKNITKSQFNAMIIKYAFKYSLVTLDEDKVNINEEKMPSNKDEFPYTLSNVTKSIYEIEMYKENENFKNPRLTYAKLKPYYERINRKMKNYFGAIVNINYENTDEFELSVNDFFTDYDALKKYIKYVKDNKIKVEGTAKVINPVIYYDGANYRARVKLEYEVKEGKSLKNVLYGDTDSEYKLEKVTKYIDTVFYINDTYNNISIKTVPIDSMISGKITNNEKNTTDENKSNEDTTNEESSDKK